MAGVDTWSGSKRHFCIQMSPSKANGAYLNVEGGKGIVVQVVVGFVWHQNLGNPGALGTNRREQTKQKTKQTERGNLNLTLHPTHLIK